MKKNNKLKEALENMLKIAECKLQYAIDKNKKWDIKHYKNNINFIKSELEKLNNS